MKSCDVARRKNEFKFVKLGRCCVCERFCKKDYILCKKHQEVQMTFCTVPIIIDGTEDR